MLDAWGCDPGTLDDEAAVGGFLDDLVEAIGMTRISETVVARYEAADPGDSGLSGTVLIAESHISIHTYPERGFCLLDVFSCKDFDAEVVAGGFTLYFGASRVDRQLVLRGPGFRNDDAAVGRR